MDFSTGGFLNRGGLLILGDYLLFRLPFFLGQRGLINTAGFINPNLTLHIYIYLYIYLFIFRVIDMHACTLFSPMFGLLSHEAISHSSGPPDAR